MAPCKDFHVSTPTGRSDRRPRHGPTRCPLRRCRARSGARSEEPAPASCRPARDDRSRPRQPGAGPAGPATCRDRAPTPRRRDGPLPTGWPAPSCPRDAGLRRRRPGETTMSPQSSEGPRRGAGCTRPNRQEMPRCGDAPARRSHRGRHDSRGRSRSRSDVRSTENPPDHGVEHFDIGGMHGHERMFG